MNLTILAVDKLREAYVRDGCALYLRRLGRYFSVNVVEVKTAGLQAEGRAMLDRLPADGLVWALDREGTELSSEQLAQRLAKAQRSGKRRLTLLIGGADGLSRECLDRADFRWSLSPLTFLHEMARLIALEQLYRAVKINRGEPYHR